MLTVREHTMVLQVFHNRTVVDVLHGLTMTTTDCGQGYRPVVHRSCVIDLPQYWSYHRVLPIIGSSILCQGGLTQ
ncbi:hypothetical protein DPMN_151538 [Dreissena polymorpha]|uniref:Uncharacterized protein n=1 Tax=Dreissena polymorpha TaxID=45954 RepID=A0A9D4FFI6_DREPO|nr:hypothetical protein DPMN_151538 [Dreissena polymorpha]